MQVVKAMVSIFDKTNIDRCVKQKKKGNVVKIR